MSDQEELLPSDLNSEWRKGQRFGRLRPVAAFRVLNAWLTKRGAKPPRTKAVTGHRTPNRSADISKHYDPTRDAA